MLLTKIVFLSSFNCFNNRCLRKIETFQEILFILLLFVYSVESR